MISESAMAQDPPVRLEQLVEAHPRGFLERPIPVRGITRRASKNGPATVPAREEATRKLLLHLVFLHCVFHFFVHFDRDFTAKTPSPETFVWFPGEHLHGAAARVGSTESAFAHRGHPYNFSIFSIWSDPKDTEKNMAWTRAFWDAMQPFMAAGTYVNYLEDEGDPRARAAYGRGYDRLVALKNKYDPTNFFRQNHNINPTPQAQMA